MKKQRDLFELFNIVNHTNIEKPVGGKVRYKNNRRKKALWKVFS